MLHVSSLWCYRAITWVILGCAFAFALVILLVRFWVLPHMGDYREPIAKQLSEATRQKVTIGKLDGRWSGLNLQLTLGDVLVYDSANRPALTLQRVDSTLSWWSLVLGEPRFDSIEIRRPQLDVRRDARGVFSVAGIELNANTDGGGISDWLLRQNEISIRDASITWNDELRAAPQLALEHVDFRFENDGNHHRFGLRAVPPAALATPTTASVGWTYTLNGSRRNALQRLLSPTSARIQALSFGRTMPSRRRVRAAATPTSAGMSP